MQRTRWLAGIAGMVVVGLTLMQSRGMTQAEKPASERPAEPAPIVVEVADPAAQLSPAQSSRYAYWLAQGVRFEGQWQPERITMVLEMLDRFAGSLGEERFVTLIRQAVSSGSDGQASALTFAMDPSRDYWVASWTPEVGRIALSESLFDQTHMDTHYRWRFVDDLAEAQPRAVTIQEFTLGHELGHLVVDALREEHIARQLAPSFLEDAYAENLYLDTWADPLQEANESVASEVALWVCGIHRSRPVQAYREQTLIPALSGQWTVGTTGSTQ